MQMIVHTNRLDADELGVFLAASRHNVAVLSDFVGIEITRNTALQWMPRALDVNAD
jgi:hypothetical protein